VTGDGVGLLVFGAGSSGALTCYACDSSAVSCGLDDFNPEVVETADNCDYCKVCDQRYCHSIIQWRRNEINIVGQGELEVRRDEPVWGSWGGSVLW